MDFLEPAQAGPAAKQPKKAAGTFASLGLSRPILRAVDRKGYKLATPIQRKCIPSIASGRDLVAMARTGSGKSAAFLLPLIDKLKMRQPKTEIRALVLSPTRELAQQTFKFVRDFARFTNLQSKLIIGGQSMGHDFQTITSEPDILVASPGRLAHVLVEMKRSLNSLQIVVFDEADRLFEPGFKELEQVNEICRRMPDSKQTLLFSATMPQRLADFAKLGLKNPAFVRLDVESNLSSTLKSIHLQCGQQDKFAILLHLLKNFVQRQQMSVVFLPTKHHIEYAKLLLDKTCLPCTEVYSSMDPEARRINIEMFQRKQCHILLVTDIAARGIDIPLLDIVINFNFPFKPKLYVHRVGRVARADRFGCAISLVSHDEMPYLHALHLFLGLGVTTAAQIQSESGENPTSLSDLPDKILGSVPQNVLDDENDVLKTWLHHDDELKAMLKVCDNAMKPYLKTREPPTPASVKAAKEIHSKVIGIHPMFNIATKDQEQKTFEPKDVTSKVDEAKETNMLERIRAYKPQATIFEVAHIKGNRKTEAFDIMQKKRQYHDKVAKKRAREEYDGEGSHSELEELHEPVIKKSFEDSKFYLKYQPDDFIKEKGLELDKSSFDSNLKRATLDIVADDEDKLKSQRHQTIWDRKRKKYVKTGQQSSRIKTESGSYISASYSSGLFEKWKSQSKFDQLEESTTEHKDIDKLRSKLKPIKRARKELKNPEEIMKERNIREKRDELMKSRTQRKSQRNNDRNTKFKGGKNMASSKKNTSSSRKNTGSSRKNKGSSKNNSQAGKQPTFNPRKGYKPPRVDGGRVRRKK